MSAGRAIDDALRAGQAYSELREQNESPPIVPTRAADWDDRPGALWIDQFELTAPQRESARPRTEGIKFDRLDRILVPTVSVGERAARVGIVVALLIATSLGFVWINGSGVVRFVGPAPSTPSAQTPAFSDSTSSSVKGDRLPIRGIADLAAPETGPRAVPQSPDIPKVKATAPSKELRPPAAATNPPEETAPRKLTAVPETRPSTIPGWTVREVVGGSAVVDGPHGALRVARGESLPGLGKVEAIVRWGNRWIVTTERGLISNN
jgi:hypothetical protein